MEEEIWKNITDFPKYQVSNLGRVKSFQYNKERILKYRLDIHGYPYINICNEGKRKTYKIHRLVLLFFIPYHDIKKWQCNHIDGNKTNNRLTNLEWVTPSENIKHAYRIGLELPRKGKDHPMFGKKLTKEHAEALIKANTGRKHTTEERIKRSEKIKGDKNGMYGKHHTNEAKKSMSEKRRGENSPTHKLTEEQVIEIRKLLKEGKYYQWEIAEMYGVKEITISNINTGRNWKYLI